MLLDNDFIPELTKRFDFIIAPGAGIVKNRDNIQPVNNRKTNDLNP